LFADSDQLICDSLKLFTEVKSHSLVLY